MKVPTKVKEDLFYVNKSWHSAVQIYPNDAESMSSDEQTVLVQTVQKMLKSFQTCVQFYVKKHPVHVKKPKKDTKNHPLKLQEYIESYNEFVDGLSKDKYQTDFYLILKAPSCPLEESKDYLEGLYYSIKKLMEGINVSIKQVESNSLDDLLDSYDSVLEKKDYSICDNVFTRVYSVVDYGRNGHPNCLGLLLDFPANMTISQYFQPTEDGSVVRHLELTLAKLESTINIQEGDGYVVDSGLKVRKDDVLDLLTRLAKGEDKIVSCSFYISLCSPSLEELDRTSHMLEHLINQLGLTARRTTREMNKSIDTCLPYAQNPKLDSYIFDTRSLSTLVPFSSNKLLDDDGVLYGTDPSNTELKILNRWDMANPNMIILGKSGFGKSMFGKIETARQIAHGAYSVIIDHNHEWKDFCNMLGGQYVTKQTRYVDWNRRVIVFSYEDKAEALSEIWSHITKNNFTKRILVIDEFHNLLYSNKELIMRVVKEIRKYGVAPTLITQNIKDFSRFDEAQMIFDNCSIKAMFRLGEIDLKYTEQLFDLSRSEKLYLKSAPIGHGYLFTDTDKTRFYNSYSKDEETILTTNPFLRRAGGY